MTPPTTDTSREAVSLNLGYINLPGSGKTMRVSREIAREIVQQVRALLTERDTLRDQLAAARNEALEEVKRAMMSFAHEHADHWSEEFAQGAETQTIGLIGVVDALKSTTPAPKASDSECPSCGEYDCGECECTPTPREVTVQEAARERLAAALWKAQATDTGTPQSVVDARTPEAFVEESGETRRKWFKMADASLRAIANEEQSNG